MMEDMENQEQKEGGIGSINNGLSNSTRKVLPSDDGEVEEIRLKKEKDLWYWNFACCLLHLVQAAACLGGGLRKGSTAAEFKLPLTTLFLVWSENYPGGPRYPSQELKQVGLLPFTAVTSIFSWLSAAAHLIVLLNFKKYISDLRRGINQFRWYEYALSSSLMMGLIAALFGMYDIISLVLIMSVNACMNLFGYNMENNSDIKTKKVDWISFYFGCFAGLVPWCCVFAYMGAQPDVDRIPGFVWGILVAYIIMFCTFPINMYLQYAGVSYWSDSYQGYSMGGYLFGEKVYQILSLAAKSLLLWLVYGGTNQPNSYTA
jgi:hypothetical protein